MAVFVDFDYLVHRGYRRVNIITGVRGVTLYDNGDNGNA